MKVATEGRMRWTAGNGSNVEDVRGQSAGGGFGIPLGIGGVLVLLVGSWLTGVNLFSLVGMGGGTSAPATSESRPASSTPGEDQMMVFVDAVTADIQHSWQQRLGNRSRVKCIATGLRVAPTPIVLPETPMPHCCGGVMPSSKK